MEIKQLKAREFSYFGRNVKEIVFVVMVRRDVGELVGVKTKSKCLKEHFKRGVCELVFIRRIVCEIVLSKSLKESPVLYFRGDVGGLVGVKNKCLKAS
eukprot:CAMPEP_0174275244 /NCGR_PEP_ID=MMETSP0439-20130205/59718_1 /TAXON_ID=0 /ORGANISM="Stereomyxa ramosa, Strain Chinc5" /LENGTH=97 /DNA_ID=CAMNT_0015367329 /DNA_START=1281 /DNA_END=1571 /DNA_ORIENTATION=+